MITLISMSVSQDQLGIRNLQGSLFLASYDQIVQRRANRESNRFVSRRGGILMRHGAIWDLYFVTNFFMAAYAFISNRSI